MRDTKYDAKNTCVRHCNCGHSVDYVKRPDYILCTWCGRRIYKNDKLEFMYEIRRRLKCQCGNI